jgi:N-acyl-D-aspartate/D-glutamate deacylase
MRTRKKEWKWRARDRNFRLSAAFYAKTEELIELCKFAAEYQGKCISHMRSEGNKLFEALDELLNRAKPTFRPSFITSKPRQKNWPKADELLARIERAQKEGLNVRANMYHRGWHRARRVSAAVDRRRRVSGVVQAAAGPGDAREN